MPQFTQASVTVLKQPHLIGCYLRHCSKHMRSTWQSAAARDGQGVCWLSQWSIALNQDKDVWMQDVRHKSDMFEHPWMLSDLF